MQVQFNTATNYQELTRYSNVSSIMGHERTSHLLLQCNVSTVSVIIIIIIISISIIIIMALQFLVGPWPLFSFLILYTENHKHRINAHNTDIRTLSGFRTHDPSVRASKGHSDRPTV
jgi:hypothetical protein